MTLSVLSMLARTGVDPWREAAELARLPGRVAVEKLVSLIAALPDGVDGHRDPATIAIPLIALLPRRSRSATASRQTLSDGGAAGSHIIAITAILMAFLLGAGWILASRGTSAQADGEAHMPLSSTVP